MTDTSREFGVIGLGNIGGNLTAQALDKRFRVVGYDKREAPQHLLAAGLEAAQGVSDFRDKLARPRAIFLYLYRPAESWTRCWKSSRRISTTATSLSMAATPTGATRCGGTSG